MEQELSEFEKSSDWTEKVPSESHQPPSPSLVGSMETKLTVPEEHPTGPEARKKTSELTVPEEHARDSEATQKVLRHSTIPEDHPTDPERPRKDDVRTEHERYPRGISGGWESCELP